MGKIAITTPEQQLILKEFRKNQFFTSSFYFTGGTALSLYYLKHRQSIDLDFFSESRFDVNNVSDIIHKWSKVYKFTVHLEQIENLNAFILNFQNKAELKVDFAHYPHKRIENSKIIERMEVDSILDISVNKLNSVIQRNEVKDFVDLYFLLQKYTIWDLITGVLVKFGYETEPFLIARDFMKVEDFKYLPKMIIPLTLEELKLFFRKKAKALGMRAVKK